MAETQPQENITPANQAETTFRKKNQWHSFMGNLYGALGGAAFIGLLGTLATAVVKVAAGAAAEAAIFTPLPLMVMGGLMAVGTLCIWMSQREYTELKCIGDEHLAHQMQHQNHGVGQTQPVEYPQNCRKDKNTWVGITQMAPQAQHLRG